MKYLNNTLLFTPVVFLLSQCQVQENSAIAVKMPEEIPQTEFQEYWYRGLAELNSYHLQQYRYGELREGDAVLVFVTEDFSKSKQVKLDHPEKAGADKVSVLKLNAVRKFKTGIYDYSILQSVFTPVDIKNYPHTLKTSTSSQEWCGHTFTQLNLEEKDYRLTELSYFEDPGDRTTRIKKAMLEDELWTRIRIDPQSIPTGNVELIPSSLFARLTHADIQPKQARIRLEKSEAMNLIVEYLHFDRTLTIRFEENFPHRILSWEESNGKDWLAGGLSKASLKKTIRSAYWTKNKNEFEPLRDTLQLTY
ncbi:MAG: hypothetical protein D6714_11295 [Bacteroidetes bacterium]|nr:MAG: hypothetical protein D6714_11295 [Bacteroidota bacterium]